MVRVRLHGVAPQPSRGANRGVVGVNRRVNGLRMFHRRRTLCAAALAGAVIGGCASGPPPPPPYIWGNCDYERVAEQLKQRADLEMQKVIEKRSRDAGVHLLDYASACLACGRVEEAQQALYQSILLTNDLTVNETGGKASLIFAESLKTWQGEAYERATLELLHGVCLMKCGDYDNARVAFDRAIGTDRFSHGGVAGVDGQVNDKSGLQVLTENEQCVSRGGSLYRRDFLPAYLLRTLCYVQQGRMKLAEKSHEQFAIVYEDLQAMPMDAAALVSAETWTGKDGRYNYPTGYVPPAPPGTPSSLLGISFEELVRANLVVIAATGSRPRKVRVGRQGYGETQFVHDSYLAPSESLDQMDLMIDGHHAGAMTQCLNLFSQVAGRGPSAKDLSQQFKQGMEDFGEVLEDYGSYGVQYIGSVIRAINQEEADVRQWALLPNAIHLWIGRVEPGPHELTCLGTGRNLPVREEGWTQFLVPAVQGSERAYLNLLASDARRPERNPVAARHTRIERATIPQEGLATVFVAERFNAHVTAAAPGEPRVYELLPRRTPPRRK